VGLYSAIVVNTPCLGRL